jgi:hypothetical protein
MYVYLYLFTLKKAFVFLSKYLYIQYENKREINSSHIAHHHPSMGFMTGSKHVYLNAA